MKEAGKLQEKESSVSYLKRPSGASIGTCYYDLVLIADMENDWVSLATIARQMVHNDQGRDVCQEDQCYTPTPLRVPLGNRCCSYLLGAGAVRPLLRQ